MATTVTFQTAAGVTVTVSTEVDALAAFLDTLTRSADDQGSEFRLFDALEAALGWSGAAKRWMAAWAERDSAATRRALAIA